MKELIGHKILDIEVGDNEISLRFTTDKNTIIYNACGDCCSESWFGEIISLDNLINHTIAQVEILSLPQYQDGHTRQEFDRIYGFGIATEAGHSNIIFRNSSNGYYGGSCELDDGYCKIVNWYSIKHLQDWIAYEKGGFSYFKFLKLKAFL
jgi:hypothetical protein